MLSVQVHAEEALPRRLDYPGLLYNSLQTFCVLPPYFVKTLKSETEKELREG